MQKTLQSIFIHLSVLLLNLVLRERRIMAQGTFIREWTASQETCGVIEYEGEIKYAIVFCEAMKRVKISFIALKQGYFFLLYFCFNFSLGICYFSVGFWYQIKIVFNNTIDQYVVKFDRLNYIYLF